MPELAQIEWSMQRVMEREGNGWGRAVQLKGIVEIV